MNQPIDVSPVPAAFQPPDYSSIISEEIDAEIRQIEHFADSQFRDLDIAKTLEFYTNRYVRQIFDFTSITNETVIADVGAGFGWLPIAFALTTDARLISIDADDKRVAAGKRIAELLGVGDRIDWRTGVLGALPLEDREADISYCIEVLEHVQKDPETVKDLCRVTREFIVLTTPNLWFPVVAHDTRLPFCHWLPMPLRQVYARIFNRHRSEKGNLFWSPYSLRKNMAGFRPVSKWLHYSSLSRFKETFPYYLPYGRGKHVNKLGKIQGAYYELVSKLGMPSHYFLPSLAYVFHRSNR